VLTDQLQQLTREAGGEALLLDARRHRGLIGDSAHVIDVLKNLRNAGFTRLIDYTATHLGIKQINDNQVVENFQLSLVLRAPEHGHEHLVLKWTWPPPVGAELVSAQRSPADDRGRADTRSAPTIQPSASAAESGIEEKAEPPAVDPELARLGVTAHEIGPEKPEAQLPGGNGDGLPPRPESPEAGYNSDSGAGQPGGEPQQAGPVEPHPSLSHIWPAAGLAEREIWEMLGIPFSGHDNLAPLLLDEQFNDFPLRRDFAAPERPNYAAGLLRERDEQALLAAVEAAPALPTTADQSVGQAARLPDAGTAGGPPAPQELPRQDDANDSGGAE